MMITSEEVYRPELRLPVSLSGGLNDIETESLVKRFGKEPVLRGVHVQVPSASVYVLVGPNGAGKSTVFKVLLDLLRADSGSARVLGLDPSTQGHQIRSRIGYVPEHFDWGYPWMRVGQLLKHHATYYSEWDSAYAATLIRRFGLRTDARFGTLSKGQSRRVHLTMALAHRPRLLMLDEPTDGLDPIMLDETLGILADHIAETPTTVLISSHQIHDVDRLAEFVGVLADGRVIFQSPRDTLRRKLLRYFVHVPEPWRDLAEFDGVVLRRESLGREIRWWVWGDEEDVIHRFARAGATVRKAEAVSLTEATLALLSGGEEL